MRIFFTLLFVISASAWGQPYPFYGVFPDYGGPSGGTVVHVAIDCTVHDCADAAVSFGGQPAAEVRLENGRYLYAVTPPRAAAGAVDVRVRTRGGEWVVDPGFRYVSPADYEAVLLPVYKHDSLAGAFDSRWRTWASVYNANDVSIVLDQDYFHFDWQCVITCTGPPQFFPHVFTGVGAGGRTTTNAIVFVRKPANERLTWSLLVAEETRGGNPIQVPVAHERDFRERVVLSPIIADEHSRTTLRIFVLPNGRTELGEATVRFMWHEDVLYETAVPLRYAPGAIGTLDAHGRGTADFPLEAATGFLDVGVIAAARPEFELGPHVEITTTSGQRIWAFLSTTDNATQQVTIVSPQ